LPAGTMFNVANGGYAQFEKTFAGAPTAGDCDAAAELGRLTFDTTNSRFYYCTGATGWVYNSLGASGGSGQSSGTAGYIQISDGSGGFTTSGTTANEQFFWDNTNKRLGIGTATPSTKLEVASGVIRAGDLTSPNADRHNHDRQPRDGQQLHLPGAALHSQQRRYVQHQFHQGNI